jgi:hypothetical protein
MVIIDIVSISESYGQFFWATQNFLIGSPKVRQNHRVKLDKATAASKTKLAEPTSFASQRNTALG